MGVPSLWPTIRKSLIERLGSETYDTWFSNIRISTPSSDTIRLETPDEFFKNWIIEHFREALEEAVHHAGGNDLSIEYAVTSPQFGPQHSSETPPRPKPSVPPTSSNFNPRFTFENFVIGPSNRFAYAACMAVAESPARAYNPLFIYGPVGLGKTHLMQAIAFQIQKHHPNLHCVYISSERFTNELIEAIRHRATQQFRKKYRGIDVLLIDDIHFIAGKESTQEEFFHNFNTLHNNHKQIIISSDRPPKEIANLEERLRSRFTWGLITDIQPPDYETRVAILRKKSEQEPIRVPDSVIAFIAEQIKTNIRELEGALIRVVAYAILEDKAVTLDMAQHVLKDMVRQTEKIISIEMIQKSVGEFFHLRPADLKSRRRTRDILLPRQIAMFLCRQLTSLSLPEIGFAFGGKDHTTVLHACRKISGLTEKDPKTQAMVQELLTILKR